MPEHHLSRKELKQDKIHDAFEHGAEAVYSHKQVAIVALLAILAVAVVYGGWTLYKERQTAAASAGLDEGMRAYSGRIAGSADSTPVAPGELTFGSESERSTDAARKFLAVADKYPNTNPGRLARYYAALCQEDLEQFNQAQENLKKLSSGSDKELASMAQYQIAVIYGRTGKIDDAVKILRPLADKNSVFVPRPLVLLELASFLRQTKPAEAATVYQQIKKEFPSTAIAEEADRGLDTLAPKS